DPNEEVDKKDIDEDPIVSDKYNRTLIECLPKFWPKTSEIEFSYKKLKGQNTTSIHHDDNENFTTITP
ncbi:unnamed protein product, partial [Rotaria sp. Silwood1]